LLISNFHYYGTTTRAFQKENRSPGEDNKELKGVDLDSLDCLAPIDFSFGLMLKSARRNRSKPSISDSILLTGIQIS
jgi:hypothetical protein